MKMFIFVFYGIAVAHKAATITALDDDLVPIVEISSALETQYPLKEAHIGRPVDGWSCINEIILSDELIALMQAGGQIVLHAPSKIDLFPKDKQLVGDDIEIQRIRGVCVDGVRRAIHAHRPCFDVELHLAEEVYALRADDQQQEGESFVH